MPQVRFSELPKTTAFMGPYQENNFTALQTQAADEPDNPRWPYYLGHTLEVLKRFREAIPHFQKALAMETHPGHSAWICFQIGVCHHLLQEPAEALAWCLKGMEHAPNYPELAWLAGVECILLRRWRAAIFWARIALVHSWQGKSGPETERLGFRHPTGLFDGPWYVLGESYQALGNTAAENRCLLEVAQAKEARESFFEHGIVIQRQQNQIFA